MGVVWGEEIDGFCNFCGCVVFFKWNFFSKCLVCCIFLNIGYCGFDGVGIDVVDIDVKVGCVECEGFG